MRFRRLKLSGFKSFVEPAELRIEPGLTGVVGPNGCGKSNLLEAIRWVMGESSARSMRGGGMDDVIFAGTAQRPPRDFAEVALLTEDGAGAEIEVVRRIERGAGSAYRVNGRDARARDVALIFADAATGAHSPALVSQGRIAAVIAAKPAERRLMLEEAAGISGLHARRKDAETRLRATEANLARLHDALAGLDGQIAALRRQARAAERYRLLSEAIKLAEARTVFAHWRDAAAAADAARNQAEQAGAAVTAAQDRVATAQRFQAKGAVLLAAAREALHARRTDASAQAQRLATLAGQLESAGQRLADLDRERARMEADRGDADRLTRDAVEALARLETASAEQATALVEDETHRPVMLAARDGAERRERAAELALAQATAAQAGVEAEWRIASAALTSARGHHERVAKDLAQAQALLAALLVEPDPSLALAQAVTRRDAAATALASAQTGAAAVGVRKAALQAERDAAASGVAAARAALAATEREHAALLRDREARARQSVKRGAGASRAAIDGLRVTPGHERALAAVLGRDARAPLGPAMAGDGRFWTGAGAPAPVAGSLLVEVQDCPEELRARLALVLVVDADDGRVLPPGHWLVTREGRLRRWDGFVAQGEGGAEAALLEAENRFAELAERLPGERASAATAEAEQAQANALLVEAQREVGLAERALVTAGEEERAALRMLDRAEDARGRYVERRGELDSARDALARRVDVAQVELEAAAAALADLPDPAAGRAALASAQRDHAEARLLLQGATAALSAHDQAIARHRERAAAQRSEIKGWQARAGDAAQRLAGMERRRDEIAAEHAVFAAKPPALRGEMAEAERVQGRLADELARAATALTAAETAARDNDAVLAEATEALASARETRAGSAARAEAEEQRRAEFARVSGERFQCPPPLLPGRLGFAASEVGAAAEQSSTLDRLTADRERIGPVNLVAATELSEAEAAAAASAAEQTELTEAVNRLRGSIGSLNREGRERLRAAFTAVDGHFRDLFTRLFQGGQAQLALVDADDPLEAGLEIYAQPPGKRLQSLTLLSGGEQALTAVALIFALFLTNPAPICVLDEVDAPLDDANVDRFCDLLDAMVGRTDTRYLIVTHNAVTMSRMHRLFGVTMIERGVSRLVSVDLGGAEQLLAAE